MLAVRASWWRCDGRSVYRGRRTVTTREPFPDRRGRDHARIAIESAVAAVPWVGGAGAELLNFYLPAALEKRRDRWFKLLDERLADLEDRVFDDEAFQTVVLTATKAALGTHLESKMRLLAEAVRSSASVIAEGSARFMAMRFLQWVDELEPTHFEILAAIRNDRGWGGHVTWRTVLDRAAVEDEVWYQALGDLTSRRLVGTTGYNSERPVVEYEGSLIWGMELGAELVDFVQLMSEENSADNVTEET